MNQPTRDALSGVLFVSAVATYVLGLQHYLSALGNSRLLLYIFMASPAIGFVRDFRRYPRRMAGTKLVTSAVYYALAVLVAFYFKEWYVGLARHLALDPQVAINIGPDYVAALGNKAFGIGGCFALCLLFTRLAIYSRLERYFTKLLLAVELRPILCTCCGQTRLPPIQPKEAPAVRRTPAP